MPARILLLSLLVIATAANAAGERRRAVDHPSSSIAGAIEGGYTDRASVEQGRPVAFHISSAQSPLKLELVNLAARDRVLATLTVTTSLRDCAGKWESGCGWPESAALTIAPSWSSGYYAARFTSANGTFRYIPFIVRAAVPGSSSRTLIVSPTHTYQAYNSFGGKSLYPSNSPDRAYRVTYGRPYHQGGGLGLFRVWEDPFLRWMSAEKRTFEAATDVDLEDPTLLPNYDLVIFVGHSEYWTAKARQNLEDYSSIGGHIAILGGNTMWWQARYEADGRKLVVYKSATSDPEAGRNNAIVTTNWFAEPVNRPENLIVGASFRHGGYTNPTGTPAAELESYTVADATHWIFDGIAVQPGQSFGRESAGWEVDGALHNCDRNGVAGAVDGSDGTPLNYHVLAVTPATSGWGTVGIYTNAAGGTVFNAGTQDWVLGLAADPIVRTMTRNVLNRLSTGDPLPYDPVTSNLRADARFNCPMARPNVIPGWRGDAGGANLTVRCAYEGPSGLELAGTAAIAFARNFAPTFNSLRDAHVRFYLNADAMTIPLDTPQQLASLQHRHNRANARVARLDVMRNSSGAHVRLSQYRTDGTRGATTPWVPLGAGWRSIALRWQSPGMATLQVDDGAVQTVENPEAGQLANEVVLSRSADPAGTHGYVCVDALAVATGPIARVPPLR